MKKNIKLVLVSALAVACSAKVYAMVSGPAKRAASTALARTAAVEGLGARSTGVLRPAIKPSYAPRPGFGQAQPGTTLSRSALSPQVFAGFAGTGLAAGALGSVAYSFPQGDVFEAQFAQGARNKMKKEKLMAVNDFERLMSSIKDPKKSQQERIDLIVMLMNIIDRPLFYYKEAHNAPHLTSNWLRAIASLQLGNLILDPEVLKLIKTSIESEPQGELAKVFKVTDKNVLSDVYDMVMFEVTHAGSSSPEDRWLNRALNEVEIKLENIKNQF